MNSKTISNGILRALLIIVGVALLLFFLWKIQSVLVYIIIAGVLSLIARPIIIFLKHKLKFPNTIAVVVTMALFIGFLFGLIRMFIPLISQQGENLSLLNINELSIDKFGLQVFGSLAAAWLAVIVLVSKLPYKLEL
jgi:predicted PurR-regulated permease PerM